MNDLTRLSTEDLASRYRSNRRNTDKVLEILRELERRDARRRANCQQPIIAAQELMETIRRHLGSNSGTVPQECVAVGQSPMKPWYFRGGVIVSFVGLAVVGIAQGIFHDIGFHMWGPILDLIRSAGSQWGLN